MHRSSTYDALETAPSSARVPSARAPSTRAGTPTRRLGFALGGMLLAALVFGALHLAVDAARQSLVEAAVASAASSLSAEP